MSAFENLTPQEPDLRLPSTEAAAEHIRHIALHSEGLVVALKSLVSEADAATQGASAALAVIERSKVELAQLVAAKEAAAAGLKDLQDKADAAEARYAKAEKAREALRKALD